FDQSAPFSLDRIGARFIERFLTVEITFNLFFRVVAHFYRDFFDDPELWNARAIENRNAGEDEMSFAGKRAKNGSCIVDSTRLTDLRVVEQNHGIATDDMTFRMLPDHRCSFSHSEVQGLVSYRMVRRGIFIKLRVDHFEG